MNNHNIMQQIVVITLMMFFAFYLQELPTSNGLQFVLPEWPFLLTIYFSVSSRYFFSVTSAFFIGLVQDVFLGIGTLGLHAGIYVLAAFIITTMRLYFKHSNIVMQSLIIALLVVIKIIILAIYSAIFYSIPSHYWSFLSIPLSAFAWPLVYYFFHFFASRHRHR